MNSVHTKSHTNILKRICAMFLCVVMIFTIMPKMPIPEAKAASNISTQYEALDKLVEWGIMRGDQAGNLSPNRAITRAEFVTMLNRAFGYKKTGSVSFKDVNPQNWFYDDISIAVKAGYFQGTGKSEASPNGYLTREAATVMLCRNLMLQPLSGEDLSFKDSRDASDWSRGYIKAAAEKGIVKGDTSGTFRPRKNISRGEVAIMLARVIGTPVQVEGTYSQDAYGNLIVSTSGVTLSNMTITGDLYITAGVGLGYVTLNNVTVYGSIIASGTGESNKGDASIIIKNSTASQMIVDSPSNQYVTVKVTGTTSIDKIYVRTNAYLEDKTDSDYGMKYIEVDGEEGTKLDLAGNIKEVVTITPKTSINVGSGTVEKMTIDEAAVGTTVKIDQGATVKVLNLDTATTVTGKGDISSLYVNAPGCKVEMLPDYIYIRPGITANINGTEMDSTLAQQMSDSPRILAGYPRSDDIGPNKINVKYMTNKSGTLYWTVRLSGDGAMSASDIINPPSYGAKVIKSGNIKVNDANSLVTSDISGLQLDTSYVLSAVFVDARDDRSPVKALYFTTPDNSKPAFTSGYPKATLIEDTYVVFDVATSKTCTLYWAIYKKGMTAPKANDFKDGTLTGSIDSGIVKMIKNEDDSITMGNVVASAKNALTELTEYDVYFFLTDTVNESAVTKVSIKTADRTPPEFLTNYPRITKVEAKSLGGEGAINEDGKIYWALVKHGTEYPITNPALNNPADILLDQKLQIKGGMYALKSGSVSAKQDKPSNISFSGLEAEGAYDIYFVAEDNSGNLSDIVKIDNAKTLDSTAPKLVEQRFSQTNNDGIPLADTDVTLIFSEDIYYSKTRLSLVEMYNSPKESFELYGTKDQITFSEIINDMFTFKNLDIQDPNAQVVEIDVGIKKANIDVKLNEEGQTEVTFNKTALKLKSGTRYQFILNYVTDSSANNMPRNTEVEPFKTLDAQINLTQLPDVSIDYPTGTPMPIDVTFSSIPFANSTQNASQESYYDFLIASDTTISFELYRKEIDSESGWEIVDSKDGTTEFTINHTIGDAKRKWTALSLNYAEGLSPTEYKKVIDYPEKGFQFAIVLKSINQQSDPNKWDATINLNIFCIAGKPTDLDNLTRGGSITTSDFQNAIKAEKVSLISNPTNFGMEIVRVNQSAPQFMAEYPKAEPGDSITKINYMLDREGTVYYVAAPAKTDNFGGLLEPEYEDGHEPPKPDAAPDTKLDIGDPEKQRELPTGIRNHYIVNPKSNNIKNPVSYPEVSGYRSGKQDYPGTGVSTIEIKDLEPNTKYNIYFVLEGSYKDPSPVMLYQFNTSAVIPPVLIAWGSGSNAGYTIEANVAEGQKSVIANTWWSMFVNSKTGSTSSYPALLDSTDWTDNPEMKDKTILEALLEKTDDAKSNSFNMYAKKEAKNQVYNLLANPQTAAPQAPFSGRQAGMDSSKPPSNTVSINEKLKANQYFLLVVAQNDQGGEYVFSIIDGLTRTDNNEPLIKSLDPGGLRITAGNTITGDIMITFDKGLYVKENLDNGTPKTYGYSSLGNKRQPSDIFDPALVGNKDDDIDGGTIKRYGDDYITISVNRVQPNSYVSIIPRIYAKIDEKDVLMKETFCSKDGDERTNPVVIKINLDQDGKPICYVNNSYTNNEDSTSEVPPDEEE